MTQSDKLICFIGPKGTSDHRAISLFESVGEYQPLPMSTVSEIIETVNFTPGCLGVVPIENSTDGELTTITDKLVFEARDVRVQEEAVLVEGICAFGLSDPAAATTVISHPQVLELCSRFIRERGLSTRHVLSTAEACRWIAVERDISTIALAPPVVGKAAGLNLYSDAVLDVPEIRTRYVLIGQGIPKSTGSDRTILVITPSFDAVGSLSQISSVFARHAVNLTSILSRPLSAKLGFHTFQISCEGHISDTPISGAVAELLSEGHSVKHLGSFPRWRGAEVTTPFSTLPLGSIDAAELSSKSLVEVLRTSGS